VCLLTIFRTGFLFNLQWRIIRIRSESDYIKPLDLPDKGQTGELLCQKSSCQTSKPSSGHQLYTKDSNRWQTSASRCVAEKFRWNRDMHIIIISNSVIVTIITVIKNCDQNVLNTPGPFNALRVLEGDPAAKYHTL